MKVAATTFLVSCLLAASVAQLLPCAPDCSDHHDQTLYPNPHDCTKYFQCASNVAIPRNCHDGLHFNPVIEVCDYPDSAGCTADPDFDCRATTPAPSTTVDVSTNSAAPTTTVEPVETTTVAATTTTVPVETTTVAASTTTVPVETTTVPATTTTVPVETTTVPATTTTVPVETSTVAATTTTVPVETTTVPATTTTVPLETSTVAATTTTAKPIPSTTLPSGSTTESAVCRPECPSAEALFPNPRNCSTFYQCAFGFPFLHSCPEGQWYDGPNERCDFQENVECNADPDAPCVAVTFPTAEPSVTTTVGSGSTTTDGGEDCVPPCPSDEALYPNPRDCGSFFQCSFGVPYLMKCPPGQHYAPALERCDYPEVAECTAGPDSPCVAVTNPPQFVNEF